MPRPKIAIISALAPIIFGLIACQSPPQTTSESPENTNSQPAKTSTTDLPGKGIKIRPSCGPAQISRFIGEIVNLGLSQLGYEVENLKQLAPAALHVALSNGDLDIFAGHREKMQAGLFKKSGGDEKLEQVGEIVSNVFLGYQIDKKTAESAKITNFSQLKDPKIAKLFDSDNDGKANLAGCSAGSPCAEFIDYQIKAYGLQDTVEQDKGEEAPLLADVLARYKQGKPILYFSSNILWITTTLKTGADVIWLEVPFTSLPKDLGEFTAKDTSIDGKNIGYPIDRLRVVGQKEFLKTNPAAKSLFEQIQIPVEDINAELTLIEKGENSPEDIRRHAEAWVKNNQQKFDTWIEEAKKASKPNSN
ncbi:MAG TPA: proline/glycine betaine ABC transporter substrate-binding protein ProX [Cyanobacteria bacterium UBA11149]|nr:proline/glycine betaine ABC transporter substrate-binding protein ProX [Cyanobacteria bacterium UBA11367]HBE58150.1 proline/glycine betaine ABC transporter substrate-binding protein ProX [Cyanobacteria bacterium UBA11366]HBK64150.1 proline/glycine betaine ABC transporter substrate-binding protein ProX [Cyanobacteria bacterium UBA11166]HBR75468.1 proline/glycine betaine ABC transporter substrate-binding protein ProX [Cyanobacteria bacterium UBA11159]HBS71130.1 proline/glycine betaine ABC tran